MSLYLMLGAALALAGAYVGGRIDGQKIEQGAELRADREAEAVRVRLQGQIDASATAGQTAEFKRQSDVRSFTREKETIVERPVYRNVCVDADGVGLLDRRRRRERPWFHPTCSPRRRCCRRWRGRRRGRWTGGSACRARWTSMTWRAGSAER